jgi:GMP synthase-like glutamine amidotransferase
MRVLAILHQPDCGPGVFAEAISAAGAQLDCWLITQAPAPPCDPHDYGAVLTLGGAMHADQDSQHPWLGREKALLAELLERGVALLGVCLGAQLLAEAAGASARRASSPEIGWYQVRTSDEALDDPLIGPLAPDFAALEWHSDEFPLPPGAVSLARSSTCLQAYRLEPAAWGIQFHAEVTAPDLESWIDDYRSDPDAVAAQLDSEAFRARTGQEIEAWNALGRGLCDRFLAAAGALRSNRL